MRSLATSFFFCVTLIASLSCAAQSDTEIARAAKGYADSLAKPATAAHARSFQEALDTKGRPPAARSERKVDDRATKGDITSDPRYQSNLEKMFEKLPSKIWGGIPVTPGEYPDTVAVLGPTGICTGTLIAPDVVLTAAHCACDGVTSHIVVGDREDAANETINIARVVSRVACPGRDLTSAELRQGDQALMFLEKRSATKPRRLATPEEISAVGTGRAVGFGRTNNAGAGRKYKVDIPFATNNCASTVKTPDGVTDDDDYYGCEKGKELVAGKPRLGKDTCNGDSGGPLFIEAANGSLVLAATTSRAVVREGYANCGDGGIYVRVDGKALEWIRSQGVNVAGGESPTRTEYRLASYSPLNVPAYARSHFPVSDVGISTSSNSRVIENARLVDFGNQRLAEVSLKGQQLKYPITNPEAIPPNAVAQRGRLTFAPASDNSLRILSFESAHLRNAQTSVRTLEGNPKYANLIAQMAAWANESRNATTNFESPESIEEAERMTAHELIAAFLRTPAADERSRRAIIKAYMEILASKKSKALYGRDDRFRPLNYQQIYANSRGGVAIRDKYTKAYSCSGALIGNDWALTAAHCVPALLTEHDIVFNYEKDLANQDLKIDSYPILSVLRNGSDSNLDFAVLKLGKNGMGKSAGEVWAKQCLSEVRQRREFPLYVVGHPSGDPRTVADNGFVIFPFEATEVEFAHLQMLVEAELEQDPDKARRLKQFRDSYRRRDTNRGTMFENYSVRWHRYPVIGADTDTFHGNSGSPVYSRTDHAIVGILIEGEPDVSKPWQPGWRRHEAILAIKKIMEDLDAKVTGWRDLIKPCIRRLS